MKRPGMREKRFMRGDRVRIAGPEAGWRQPCTGSIVGGPEPIVTLPGPDFHYWVEFDVPQHDLSEDGPYVSAQILSCYLEPVGAGE